MGIVLRKNWVAVRVIDPLSIIEGMLKAQILNLPHFISSGESFFSIFRAFSSHHYIASPYCCCSEFFNVDILIHF